MKILIVGADSGIGQALCRKLSVNHSVTGTSRRVDSQYIQLSLEDRATWQLPEHYDQVYYCLGIAAKNNHAMDVYNTNALLTVEFLDQLTEFVHPGGLIRVMSSIAGSITTVLQYPMTAVHLSYKMSKAALNMGVAALHQKHPGLTWQLIHPGFVKTKMTAGTLDHVPGAIDPDTCADYLLALPQHHSDRLQFLSYDGSTLGW